uniref:EGF like repeats and discoidin domains 3 n=1 Tax=Myotis lucifugus TaxID=59463 RepID=G1QCT8_MYOLU
MPGPRLLAALCGALLCASGLFAGSGDFCDSIECLNGGTCLSQDELPFYCLCPEGFTGPICNETEKGPCFPNPCRNDAECQVLDEEAHRGDVFKQYVCECKQGYSGVHCESMLGFFYQEGKRNTFLIFWSPGEKSPRPGPGMAAGAASRCAMPLGMETGAIADRQISASSVHLGFMALQRWAPELARLHRSGIVNAWTASNYDRKPWIQVNLLRRMQVTGVVTQGASRAGRAEYVKVFKVAYSLDGKKFKFIQDDENSGDKKLGNPDYCHVLWLQVNRLTLILTQGYLSVDTVTCWGGVRRRVGELGCTPSLLSENRPQGSPRVSVKLGNTRIANTKASAHVTDAEAESWQGQELPGAPLLAGSELSLHPGAWGCLCGSRWPAPQIDLGSQKQVTGIITQGARDFGNIQYVAYKVAHSTDGLKWTEYKDPGA